MRHFPNKHTLPEDMLLKLLVNLIELESIKEKYRHSFYIRPDYIEKQNTVKEIMDEITQKKLKDNDVLFYRKKFELWENIK